GCRIELADGEPVAQNDDAVAEGEELVELGGGDDNGGAAAGCIGDAVINVGACDDVDPLRRLVEQEYSWSALQPARDDDFLLVTAREGADGLFDAAGAHSVFCDESVGVGVLESPVGAQLLPESAQHRYREVLANAEFGEDSFAVAI